MTTHKIFKEEKREQVANLLRQVQYTMHYAIQNTMEWNKSYDTWHRERFTI